MSETNELKCPVCGNVFLLQTTLGWVGGRQDPNTVECACGARGNVDDWRAISGMKKYIDQIMNLVPIRAACQCFHIQNCHRCDSPTCCDNTNVNLPAIKKAYLDYANAMENLATMADRIDSTNDYGYALEIRECIKAIEERMPK